MNFISTRNTVRLHILRAFLLNVNEMVSLSFASTSRTNTVESTSQVNYTFQERCPKCQTKHLFMNIVEYFETEAKKSKGLVSHGQTVHVGW